MTSSQMPPSQMTLDQILRHPLFPFADFRTNDASFLMLELYWAAVAQQALGPEVSARVAPLMEADRDPENWGDPVMLDFWLPDIRRGARILLAENVQNWPSCVTSADKETCFAPIIAYANRRGITGPDDVIDQIGFFADMSAIARAYVQRGLVAYLVTGVSLSALEDDFDALLAANYRLPETPLQR